MRGEGGHAGERPLRGLGRGGREGLGRGGREGVGRGGREGVGRGGRVGLGRGGREDLGRGGREVSRPTTLPRYGRATATPLRSTLCYSHAQCSAAFPFPFRVHAPPLLHPWFPALMPPAPLPPLPTHSPRYPALTHWPPFCPPPPHSPRFPALASLFLPYFLSGLSDVPLPLQPPAPLPDASWFAALADAACSTAGKGGGGSSSSLAANGAAAAGEVAVAGSSAAEGVSDSQKDGQVLGSCRVLQNCLSFCEFSGGGGGVKRVSICEFRGVQGG